jgi:hypothetical protein
MKNEFKNKKTLQKAIENPTPEFQDSLDKNFRYLFLDDDSPEIKDYYPLPYWIEDGSDKDSLVELVEGYYEPLKIGEVKEIDSKMYKYAKSIKLDEEIEHQAEDDSLVYEYRGFSFLRIWEPIKQERSYYY